MPNGYHARLNENDEVRVYVCEPCGATFERECGRWDPTDTNFTNWQAGIRDHMSYCYVCCTWRCGDYTSFDSCAGCGDGICSVCVENGIQCCAGQDDYIHDYSYKPSPVWFGGHNAPYHIGFELEITANSAARPIYEWAEDKGVPGLFYCKDDSSVDGFEIVTHPMTQKFFHAFRWTEFFDMLAENYPVHSEPVNDHGLHVHISRRAFERPTQLARFSYMLQSRANQSHVIRVARRNSSWGSFSSTPVSDVLPAGVVGRRARGKWQEIVNRLYESGMGLHRAETIASQRIRMVHQFRLDRGYPNRGAVNLQNSETVEVRAAGSTRVVPEFQASVGLVIAAADYVRTMQPCHATVPEALSWDAFSNYVQSREDIPVDARSIITGK